MLRRTIGIVFVATLLPLTARAQAPAPPAAKETPKEAKETPRAYVPGLEQFMNVILIEHNKLWFAARERNWPLAPAMTSSPPPAMHVTRGPKTDSLLSSAQRNRPSPIRTIGHATRLAAVGCDVSAC